MMRSYDFSNLLFILLHFQTVFASYLDRAVHFMELPGEILNRRVLVNTNQVNWFLRKLEIERLEL